MKPVPWWGDLLLEVPAPSRRYRHRTHLTLIRKKGRPASTSPHLHPEPGAGSAWEDAAFLRPLGKTVTGGWELLSISSITSGAPFTVYSGVQQTDAGTNGADRPNQVGIPHLSTSRKVREDYFGLGTNNASYFSIPINVPGEPVRTTECSASWAQHVSRAGLL